MAILQTGLAQAAAATGAYQIARSLRFNSADSAYLNRTPGSAGNQTKWTYSTWVKRSTLASASYVALFSAATGATGADGIFFRNDGLSVSWGYAGTGVECYSAAVFRDLSAYYHIVVAVDTSQATAANRLRIYVNNVEQTLTGSPTQNSSGSINATRTHNIGRWFDGSTGNYYLNGYMADIIFVDGQQLTPSSFAETDANTNVWNPKAYTGTYGTNGFYLNFSDNSNTTAATLGKDLSSNGNNYTPNNFSVTAGVGNDSLVDSPTNYGTDTGAGGEVRGNYATLNPLDKTTTATLANGNLDFTSATIGHNAVSTIGMSSGKWYWEAQSTAGTTQTRAGVYGTAASSLYSFAANATVYGFRFDADAGTLDYTANGSTWTSLATGLTSGPYFAYLNNNGTTSKTISVNFGQYPFSYTAPSGFKALCTQNLVTPAIGATSSTLASKNFNVKTYTGNGTTTGNTQAITGLGFQPDLVWIKSRSSGTQTHLLTDAVRGANKLLYSPLTDAEATVTNVMNSFDADGFTAAYNSSYSAARSNENAVTYAAWAWKCSNTTVSNTSGSITSTVSANPAAGISIVGYIGTGANATVGHGLGVAPKMVIVKSRSIVAEWRVYHDKLTSAVYHLKLSATDAETSGATTWNSTAPTSTVFSLGSSVTCNTNGATYIAYCFAEVAGFSKFGSYTGNGSADGPFVYCGFRPRYVMVKRTNATSNWSVYDTARDSYNDSSANLLYPNLSNAETALARDIDFLSNGFKLRSTDTDSNASGSTYIFAAFAEVPFNYSRAR